MVTKVATTSKSEKRSSRGVAACSVLLAGLVLSPSGGAVDARPIVAQADEDDAGFIDVDSVAVGSTTGQYPSVSGDGRFVVFTGEPADEDDTRSLTVFLTDRETEETVELTPVPSSIRTGDSTYAVISGDGCSVATVTELALDVFRDDDTGDRWDVYRSTLPHCGGTIGAWDLVSSRAQAGGLARDDVAVAPPTMSRSGTLIAYTHPADHLFEPGAITTVSIVDLEIPIDGPGRSQFIAGSPADSPTDTFLHAGLSQPAISDNGRFVAFRSDAQSADAVPGWSAGLVDGGPATPQVYVWDREEADPFLAVTLVSRGLDGAPSLTGAAAPDISRDGTSIAFTSTSPALVNAQYPDCSLDCPDQVFLLDRDSNDDGSIDSSDQAELRLISAENNSDPLIAGRGPSTQPALSADGQLVAFVTKAPNLQLIEVPALGGGDDGDLLLAEVQRGHLSRLTNVVGQVLPTQGVHAHPDLSDSGRTAVFDTVAARDLLVAGALSGRQVVARTSKPTLSFPEADVGTTLVNVPGDEWYVAVINDGPSSFRPTQVTISNSRFSIDEEDSSCLFASSVPAGGSCTVEVTYTPSGPGADSATITVAEEGFGAVSVSTTIRGSGGVPAFRVIQGRDDFGFVTVGEPSAELQFDLQNVSFVPADVTQFEITGVHADEFAFSTNTCVGRPLNQRATCSVGLVFTPDDAGRRTALVELGTAGGVYTTFVVAGDGEYAPVVQIAEAEIDAGRDFLATGSQYPPNMEVTVVFGDDPGATVTTITDDTGAFEVTVPVDVNERGGDRRVVVQSTSGAAASAPVEVVERNDTYIGLPGFGLG